MLLTYYLWIKAVKTGSIMWSASCALAYFYMVSSWGGYVFLINLIPLHVLVLMFTGHFSHRIYVAYSTVIDQQMNNTMITYHVIALGLHFGYDFIHADSFRRLSASSIE
jgi:asparagine N-glycosylation enzyme membrane subunit Stt3